MAQKTFYFGGLAVLIIALMSCGTKRDGDDPAPPDIEELEDSTKADETLTKAEPPEGQGQAEASAEAEPPAEAEDAEPASMGNNYRGRRGNGQIAEPASTGAGSALVSICDRSPAAQAAILDEINSWLDYAWSWLGGQDIRSCSTVTAKDLSRIISLDLSGNGLSQFDPGDLSGLSSLKKIHFDDNSFTSFPTDWIDDFPLYSVTLKNNPLPEQEKARLEEVSNKRNDFKIWL